MGDAMAGNVAKNCIFTMPREILRFYLDGFRNMVLGKTLWKIIAIKLVVMFGILKLFFFPNFLKTTFATDTERANHVLHEITVTHGLHGDSIYQDVRQDHPPLTSR